MNEDAMQAGYDRRARECCRDGAVSVLMRLNRLKMDNLDVLTNDEVEEIEESEALMRKIARRLS